MVLVFTHVNPMLVQYAAQLLRQNGIDVALRNEFVTSVMGSGAPCDAWTEVWVDEANEARALDLLQRMTSEPEGEAWVCTVCGEQNDASFEACWKCRSADSNELP